MAIILIAHHPSAVNRHFEASFATLYEPLAADSFSAKRINHQPPSLFLFPHSPRLHYTGMFPATLTKPCDSRRSFPVFPFLFVPFLRAFNHYTRLFREHRTLRRERERETNVRAFFTSLSRTRRNRVKAIPRGKLSPVKAGSSRECRCHYCNELLAITDDVACTCATVAPLASSLLIARGSKRRIRNYIN